MKLSLLPVLACAAVFLQGCACSVKEDMADLRKENLSLNRSLMQKEIELHDKGLEIALLKKDMEVRNILNEEKKKEMENKIADLEAKSARSVSVDLFFKRNPYNNEWPSEILDIWLKENRPPQNPTKEQLAAFAEKLPSIGWFCNSDHSRRKIFAVIRTLPEDFLKELIYADSQGRLQFIFEDAARSMDKETLKKFMRYSEGKPAQWVFTNRFSQLVDKNDKEFIMENFWRNQYLRKKAIEFGFHKEILPQIREKVRANVYQYPELFPIVLAELGESEKNDMLNRAWKQTGGNSLVNFGGEKNIFLENGFVPAFEQLGLIAPYIRNNHSTRAMIEKYSPVGIDELQDWVIKNKGNIVFDRRTGKFATGGKADRKQ